MTSRLEFRLPLGTRLQTESLRSQVPLAHDPPPLPHSDLSCPVLLPVVVSPGRRGGGDGAPGVRPQEFGSTDSREKVTSVRRPTPVPLIGLVSIARGDEPVLFEPRDPHPDHLPCHNPLQVDGATVLVVNLWSTHPTDVSGQGHVSLLSRVGTPTSPVGPVSVTTVESGRWISSGIGSYPYS